MKNYALKERECERAFQSYGPYWHAYTSGKITPILFANTEDLVFVMNVIAQAAYAFRAEFDPDGRQSAGVILIAFEVMNNHFHFVTSGERERIQDFFAFIRRRLMRFIPEMRGVELELKPITDLNSLRNNIVYTHRNGYVANENYTPFSYPWGSGCDYFGNIPTLTRYADYYLGPRRKMFRGRAPELPEDWPVRDGYVAPIAYCAIRFGMSMFRDAHHYFSAVSRQVEAYGELAAGLDDDGEFLTDPELFAQMSKMVRDHYNVSGLKDLSRAQKLDLARVLHYDYHSSNGQIRRVLGLSQYDVDSLFPLKAK